MRYLGAVWLLSYLGLNGNIVAADRREFAGGPYCGVYCLWTILNIYQKPVDFKDLLCNEYVGSLNGSSAEELLRAANDFGLQAVAMEQLTAGSLRAIDRPVILHVRRPGFGTQYAHWVLFLGMDGDQARIVDPPNDVQSFNFAELLSLWDGIGIIVSDQPIRTWPIRIMAYVEQGIVFLLVLGSVWILGQMSKNRRRWRIVGLMMASLVGCLAFHLWHEDGMLRNSAAVAQVKFQYHMPTLDEIATQEVAERLGQPDVTIIDARFADDYAYGHVPGAINIPIYSSLVDRSQALANIPKWHQVIVYCQSRNCLWGEIIGSDLWHRGYRRLAVYRGGYREWEEYERKRQGKKP
jgi:rhodanese-related sulfurtransferase/predicted double-glycine peptidase